ncbi:hepatitis A virus cellular receptor 1 homolog isoform X2 [Pyxicephalus adspersus]|uniref:hepatitis A virus cellular receptor 1 homolog isoform X2 n=1 Tax=Pyxicephalus adspersus TaxID=30357 RepID=UPI003B5ABE1A
MKGTCVVFCFSLLLAKGLLVSCEDFNGPVGGSVTLQCIYSIKHGTTSMCWGRGKCPRSRCNNQIIETDGSSVTWRQSEKYQLLGNIKQGNVSMTISNLSKKDEDTYCCRVEIPGLFNDERHDIFVRVHEEPKSPKPATTTRSQSSITHGINYEHTDYRKTTRTQFSAMISGTSNRKEITDVEEEEEATLDGDNVNSIIYGVVVLIILLVSMMILFSIWKFQKMKNKNKSRNTELPGLEGLDATQTQAEQNIYTL